MPDPFSAPKCDAPLRCRLLLHAWEELDVSPGGRKRMIRRRRGCALCGKIELLKYGCFSLTPQTWCHWGYLEPGELHAPWDDVIRKYVPDHPAVRS